MLRYLIKTKELSLVYNSKPINKLYNYIDLNFIIDIDNQQSISDFLFKLNRVYIHWQSKQQSLVAQSTYKVEYIKMATASYKISYLYYLFINLLNTLIYNFNLTLLYNNNISAIIIVINSKKYRLIKSCYINI